MSDWMEKLAWNSEGLIPAISQDSTSGKVLMMAWMNRESLQITADTKRAVFWSRSRQRLWRKGEESGHFQQVEDIRTDCDTDVVLLMVKQNGGIACHTGRESCFYKQLQPKEQQREWVDVEPVIKSPEEIYKK